MRSLLPTESKGLRLLFVCALNAGRNARRSSLNLYVDTTWSILLFGIEWTSCLAQGCRSLKEQVAPAFRPAVAWPYRSTPHSTQLGRMLYWLLLAESQLTRPLFGSILRRVPALPLPAG